ncbi:hypothetical protein [Polynucleobacter necessarius]|uniref:hypothetical protein n=1 Tax=Polynucleobacter necessarius TaxID=576610 RepID=UPI001E37D36E|nr:hypothetical protein [Polynucleobacter necessarius]
MLKYFRLVLVALVIVCNFAIAQDRLPEIPIEQYTSEQKQAAQEFEAVRKKAPWGPFCYADV